MKIAKVKEHLAVLIPVYFAPTVKEEVIRSILETAFSDQELFCHSANLLAVVDQGTVAERVLSGAPPGSSLHGVPLLKLPENRGKAGAVQKGLACLLDQTDMPFLVTRDCDGDHLVEDLPRLVALAAQMTGLCEGKGLSVFGVRPVLHKPMNWMREQWEILTNQIWADLVDFLLARRGKVLDRRFWNGYPLDLQSGYRLYDRAGARLAVQSLERLPRDPDVFQMACEMLPFLELSLSGAVVGQVMRSTMVEQPVSSFDGLDFSRLYAALLGFVADTYEIPRTLVVQVLDNHLVSTPAFFSDARAELLSFRSGIDPEAPGICGPLVL